MNNTLNFTCTVTESPTSLQTDAGGIVCTPVPDEQRIAFWPQHFGVTNGAKLIHPSG